MVNRTNTLSSQALPMSPRSAVNRRGFLQTAGAVSVSAALGRMPWLTVGAAEPSAPAVTAPSWVDKPMRWAQLTLVEDDPGKFDPQFWLDYFQRTKSDAVCLSAGGCVAYYPTQVPFHHRSAWLGDRDVFGELVAGCRQLGMVVIARTDPHATYDDVREAHPDWIAVDATDKPRRHWASPEMWVTCGLGPYNFEFMTEVKKEIMSRLQGGRHFHQSLGWLRDVLLRHIAGRISGRRRDMSLPRTNDPQDPARRAYILWRQQRLFDLWRLWDTEVRKINPDSCVIPNTGGGATSSLDMQRIGELAPTLIADRQARRGLTAPWANGKNGKEFRATMGRKPIVGIFSVGVEEPYRWKDSVQSEAEIRLWVADGVANGLRPWFTKFSGVLHDRRWLKPVEDLYLRFARWEKYLRNEQPLARVGLVYSQQTAWFHGAKVEDHTLGWYQALIEARIPVRDGARPVARPAHVDPFKTLILPNIAALVGRAVRPTPRVREPRRQSRRHATKRASTTSGACSERTLAWPTCLASPSKAASKARCRTPICVWKPTRRPARAIRSWPAWRTRRASSTACAASRWKPRGPFANPPLTLIPSYPDLPMEKVYPRVPKTDVPQVYLRELGRRASRLLPVGH